jgi:hypothetical protein
MKIRNLYLALKDQLPISRFCRNLLKGHLIGLLSKRSHFNASGIEKISYGSKTSATKAAASMMKKKGNYFSNLELICLELFASNEPFGQVTIIMIKDLLG